MAAATRTASGTRGSTRSRPASRSSASNHAPLRQEAPQGFGQCRVIGADDRRPGDDQHVPPRSQRWAHCPECLAKPPTHPIPYHGGPEHLARCQAEARRPEVRSKDSCRQQRVRSIRTALLDRRKILRTGEHRRPRRPGRRSKRLGATILLGNIEESHCAAPGAVLSFATPVALIGPEYRAGGGSGRPPSGVIAAPRSSTSRGRFAPRGTTIHVLLI